MPPDTASQHPASIGLDLIEVAGMDTMTEPVLVFGVGAFRGSTGGVARVATPEAAWVQLAERFGFGVILADAWCGVAAEERRQLVHNLTAHLLPGAHVRIDSGEQTGVEVLRHARTCGLEPVGVGHPQLFRRTSRITIHDLVAEARSQLARMTDGELAARMAGDPSCVVIDTRAPTDRAVHGAIPGSIHLPRTTLEWRVDPASGFSHPRVRHFDQCLVVTCADGYSSSLAAVSLQRLGFVQATDLIGGFRAWRDAGRPITAPGLP